MATTLQRPHAIVTDHPHDRELVHHAPARRGIEAALGTVLAFGMVAIAILIVAIVLVESGS